MTEPVLRPGALKGLFIILATCLTLALFQRALWFVVPGIAALIFYYCLRPAMSALVRAGVRRPFAARMVAGVLAALCAFVLIVVVPAADTRWDAWQRGAAHYLQGGLDFLQSIARHLSGALPFLRGLVASDEQPLNLQTLGERWSDRYATTAFLETLHWIPSLLLAPYLTFFLLNEGNSFKKYLIRSVPNAFFEKTLLLADRVDNTLQSFFTGLMKLMLIETACLGLGLWLLGIPGPFLLGFIAAALALVPYVGSAVGCLIILAVAATDFADRPEIVYLSLGLCLLVRALDDFVFVPLTIGRSLHIHPALSVLLLFAGGIIAGPLGLVLVLPLFGVLTIVIDTLGQIVSDKGLLIRFRRELREAPLSCLAGAEAPENIPLSR